MKEDRHTVAKVIFAGLMLIFSLLAIETIFILWTNPSLLNAPGILKSIAGMFITSGLVYSIIVALLSLIVFVMIKTAPDIRNSALIKDNTLRYEEVSDSGRKEKKTFLLSNINDYLTAHKSIEAIDDIKVYRQDNRKPLNAKTLMVELPDKRKMSFRKLSQEDPELYRRLCRFLERISDKDDIELDFRMRSYVNQENLVEKGKNAKKELRQSIEKTTDLSIRQGVIRIIDNIDKANKYINDVKDPDKLRKLYDNYLKIFRDILLNFNNIETHERNDDDIKNARKQIVDLAEVINQSFDTLYRENDDSRLEASITNLEKINEESRQLLEQSKELKNR